MTRRIIYASEIIRCHLLTLQALLTDAMNLADTACKHIEHKERSAAVGTILPMSDLLAAATATHAVILLLHRQRN